MADRAVLHLTNWSSRKLHHGTVYTIMALPRRWERGAGTVHALCPDPDDLRAVKRGDMSVDEYRRRFEAKLVPDLLRHLRALDSEGYHRTVADGDTLCCGCSRDAAACGECHRAFAAPLLVRAGWAVVLDGEPFTLETR